MSPADILYLWLGIGALGIVLATIKDVSVRPLGVSAGLLLTDALTVAARCCCSTARYQPSSAWRAA